LGVIGLYAGATGDDEPPLLDEDFGCGGLGGLMVNEGMSKWTVRSGFLRLQSRGPDFLLICFVVRFGMCLAVGMIFVWYDS
jgi:hypothetical protein